MPRIVTDPREIDVDWLVQAFGEAGVAPDAHLAGFEREVVGTGQMGRSVRFRLDWQGDAQGAPDSVVGKFPSEDPKSRATGTAQGAYEKEVRFYRDLADSVEIRTPRCFFGAVEPATGDFVLMLEDLAPATQGDQLSGCDADQAALAIAEAARLHAPRWGDPELSALGFVKAPTPEAGKLLQAIYQSVFPGFAERYGERIGPEALGVIERLGGHLASWVLDFQSPTTVVHGDYRLDNMLFGTPAGGYPLAVVDWQTVGLGPGPGDVAYFLGAGLLPEDRRKHEEALLRDYHARLLSAGVEGYDWDLCFREYRRSTFSGIVVTVVASMIVEQTERGDDMFVAMASRHAAHVADLEAESLLG